jgi:hypothetical protein
MAIFRQLTTKGRSFTPILFESEEIPVYRRLLVSKGLHEIDLRRVSGGNIAGDECCCHQ